MDSNNVDQVGDQIMIKDKDIFRAVEMKEETNLN